ncbi:MAG: FHIPEP family type III secretion protein, partial [Lachnospiraceae bacterium]|nr:FHIPEP family type III secretion protein [Lachnospiraceae bacterium]
MKENIGELICQYRQNRKMTQEEFAFRLGVTPQAVSKWERGNGLPDISLVKGICQILDISANALLGIAASEVVENDNAAMEQEIRNNMFAEPLLLEFGEGLIDYVKAGLETGYINQQRKRLAESTGILMPVLRIKDNLELEKNTYRILSYDKVLYEEKLDEGDEDAYRKMIDNVSAKCQEHYADILNKHIVKIMIDNMKELFPGAVTGLVPEKIGYLQVQRKLQEMLHQGKSIRDMLHILE